jgi:hypothetical protein
MVVETASTRKNQNIRQLGDDMGRWKYHLDPRLIKSDKEIIGIYCPYCKKIGGTVSSVPIKELLLNNGEDTPELASVIKCRSCKVSIRIDIYKHLVRVNDKDEPIPPIEKSSRYTSNW